MRSDGPGLPALLVDVTGVQVAYDAAAGALDVRFDGNGLHGHAKSSMDLALKLSAPNGGACDGRLRAGDVAVQASEVARFYGGPDGEGYRTVRLTDLNGSQVADGSLSITDEVNAVISFRGPYLLGRDYRCVSAVAAAKVQNGYLGESRDSVADFCLAGCPVISQTDGLLEVSVPSVDGSSYEPTGAIRAQAELKNTTSTTIAVKRALITARPPGSTHAFGPVRYDFPQDLRDTSLKAREVRRITQSFTLPAGAPLGRYDIYATYQDSRGNYHDGPSAFVEVKAPPQATETPTTTPTPLPTPPPSPQPAKPPSSGVNQGIIINNSNTNSQNQTTTVVSLTLTGARARGVARKALTTRYGKAFSRRTKRSYKITCKPSGAKAGCSVQWRYKRSRYKGRISITRTQRGDLWRTAIKRRAIRRS